MYGTYCTTVFISLARSSKNEHKPIFDPTNIHIYASNSFIYSHNSHSNASDKTRKMVTSLQSHGLPMSRNLRECIERDDEERLATNCDQADASFTGASPAILDIVPTIEIDDPVEDVPLDEISELLVTSSEVIQRIEELVTNIILSIDKHEIPFMSLYQPIASSNQLHYNPKIMKQFTMNQCRSFTSILLVAAFCHSLINAQRTTTNREVYYFYVTHFRSQKECDAAIWDLCYIIQTPRHMLNLMASPKGWFCGDIQLISKSNQACPGHDEDEASPTLVLDGRSLPSIHGAPISSEWLLPYSQRNFSVQTIAATYILVVEKEGIYNRLSEDGFYRKYPCILITGKGFPDFATRAMVRVLHKELNLPVRGLADCNPFGVLVLNTYRFSSNQNRRVAGTGIEQDGIPMEWVGLRPSQISHIMSSQSDQSLPQEIFQELTSLDQKRLFGTLLKENEHHIWTNFGTNKRRINELIKMQHCKVELEALNWLGMDFCSKWLGRIFEYNSSTHTPGGSNNENDQRESSDWLKII